MSDFENFVTPKGAEIILHFEDEATEKASKRNNSHKKMQARLNEAISVVKHGAVDTGPGTKVHVLINNEGDIGVFPEDLYNKWLADPNKNWNHNDPITDINLIADLLSAAGVTILEPEKPSRFIGGTTDQFDQYTNDPIAYAFIEGELDKENCIFCPAPTDLCHRRTASFDSVALEKAISEKQLADAE